MTLLLLITGYSRMLQPGDPVKRVTSQPRYYDDLTDYEKSRFEEEIIIIMAGWLNG